FKYFLEHEMFIPAFFNAFKLYFQFLDIRSFNNVINGFDHQFSLVDDGQFSIIEIDNIPGIFNQWSGIGGNKMLISSYTDYHRAAFSGTDKQVGIFFIQNNNGIS